MTYFSNNDTMQINHKTLFSLLKTVSIPCNKLVFSALQQLEFSVHYHVTRSKWLQKNVDNTTQRKVPSMQNGLKHF